MEVRRRVLKWSLLLLSTATGCQQQIVSTPGTVGIKPGGSQPLLNGTPVSKGPTKPPKDLPPLVLVSSGDFKVGEAAVANVPADHRRQIRETARLDYEKALKIDPKCVPACLGLARLYVLLEDPGRAVEAYQKALHIAPDNAGTWYELGRCYDRQKNWPAALDCLTRAARLDPGNRSIQNTMGVVFAQAGRYDDSLNCFIRSSGESLGYYRLAQTLQHLEQPELSQRFMAVALQKDPSLAATLSASGETQAPVQQTAYPQAP